MVLASTLLLCCFFFFCDNTRRNLFFSHFEPVHFCFGKEISCTVKKDEKKSLYLAKSKFLASAFKPLFLPQPPQRVESTVDPLSPSPSLGATACFDKMFSAKKCILVQLRGSSSATLHHTTKLLLLPPSTCCKKTEGGVAGAMLVYRQRKVFYRIEAASRFSKLFE